MDAQTAHCAGSQIFTTWTTTSRVSASANQYLEIKTRNLVPGIGNQVCFQLARCRNRVDKATTSIAIGSFLSTKEPISGFREHYSGREWTHSPRPMLS